MKGHKIGGAPQSEFERVGKAESAPSYLAMSVGPIALLVWRTGTSVDGVLAIAEVLSRLERELAPVPLGFLTVGAPAMSLQVGTGVREGLARVLKACGPSIGAAAVAYEGKGFKATIARSVVTAISIASHNDFPYRVFAKVAPALQWLSGRVDGVTDKVIAEVRAELRKSES